jgi:Domain of unknown function (DUF4403)
MKPDMKRNLLSISYKLLAISFLLFGCKSHQNATKSATTNATGKPIQTIDLPVFIPDTVLQNELYKVLFAAGKGKYFPCKEPNCDPKFKDLYLENPHIGMLGNLISIKVHIGGTAHLVILNTGVSVDVTLTARPEVQNDTLYFRDVELEQSSQSLLLNLTSALFRNTVRQQIEQHAVISFRSELDAVTKQAKKQFPFKYGGVTLLIDLSAIHLKSVNIQQVPDEGILVVFSADLETEDSSFAR